VINRAAVAAIFQTIGMRERGRAGATAAICCAGVGTGAASAATIRDTSMRGAMGAEALTRAINASSARQPAQLST